MIPHFLILRLNSNYQHDILCRPQKPQNNQILAQLMAHQPSNIDIFYLHSRDSKKIRIKQVFSSFFSNDKKHLTIYRWYLRKQKEKNSKQDLKLKNVTIRWQNKSVRLGQPKNLGKFTKNRKSESEKVWKKLIFNNFANIYYLSLKTRFSATLNIYF